MISFRCPACSQEFRVADDLAGQRAACTTCNFTVNVPTPAIDGAEVASAYAPPVAAGPAVSRTYSYRRATILVTGLTVLFVINGVSDGTLGAMDLLSVTTGIQNSGVVDLGNGIALSPFDLIYAIVALLTLPLYCATVIAFLMWVYRANSNARALGAEGMTYSPGWCCGWFFIPVMNLFRPYQAVREIAQASNPRYGPADWRAASPPGVLGVWWGLWLLSNFLGQLEFRLAMRDEPELETASSVVGVGTGLIGVALAVAVIRVVRGIHRSQEAKVAQQGHGLEDW